MSLFLPDYESIEFPIIPQFFDKANRLLAALDKPSNTVIFENRVTLAAYHFLATQCCFYIEKAWCCKTDEELRIHHCLWKGKRYEIAVMNGAFNRRHKNFKRIDKVCLAHVENR
jgi:hypothetical protein